MWACVICSNIAVFAYAPELYPLLKAQLTAEAFKAFYRGAIKGSVTRYEADNIEALNFVCQGGAPVTVTAPDSTGTWELDVTPGDYQVQVALPKVEPGGLIACTA